MTVLRGSLRRRSERRAPALALLIVCTAARAACAGERALAQGVEATRPDDAVRLMSGGGRLAIRTFDDRDGLPQSAGQALAIDAKGHLWVGTQDGAAFYDGRRWTAVNMPASSRSNNVKSILETPDGALWFGTVGGGIHRLHDGAWTSYDMGSGLPSDTVRALLAARRHDGAFEVLAGTAAGLARLEDARWRPVGGPLTASGANVSSLAQTPEGVWAGTNRGLYRLAGGAWTHYEAATGLPDSAVTSLLPGQSDDDGEPVLWIGTEGGLARFARGAIARFEADAGPRPTRIRTLCETASPTGPVLWVGTSGPGLYRYKGGVWTRFSVASGLPGNVVLSLLAPRAESGPRALWIGTDGTGLARLVDGTFVSFDRSNGLPNDLVYSFAEARTAGGGTAFWMATYGDGVVRFDAAGPTLYHGSGGFQAHLVFSLLSVPNAQGTDDVWAGTDGFGLGLFRSGRWRFFDEELGTRHSRVLSLARTTAEDGSPILWAGTFAGLARYHAGRWSVLTTASGLPGNQVTSLLETERAGGKRLWIGTQKGLATLEAGRLAAYQGAPGSPPESVLTLCQVRRADGGRSLWVGTFNAGLRIIDLEEPRAPWRAISTTSSPALPNNVVNAILQDRSGQVYVLTNKGLTRFAARATTADDPTPFTTRTFTTEDGLPNNEGNQNALYLDRMGRIWVGTVKGVAVIDPARATDDTSAKPLRITRVTVAGKPLKGETIPALAHHQGRVAFEFALLSYFHESETRYRTQLVGLDELPSDWSPDYKQEWAGLAPNSYVFKVWGRDYAMNVSGPLEVPFLVRPAAWQTWWAYLGYALLLASGVYGALHLRLSALRRRNLLLEAAVRDRTAEIAGKVLELEASERRALAAREEALEAKRRADQASQAKSAFLSSVSHELRTPLNAVLGFAQLMDRERGRSALDRERLGLIRRSGEHLLRLINDVLSIAKIEAGRLTLNPVSFDPPLLLREVAQLIQPRADEKRIALVVERAAGLPAAVRGDEAKLRQVLLNLLGNAVKFTDAGRVRLRAGWSEGRAEFEVSDTGHGIAEAELGSLFEAFSQAASGKRAREGTGLGLAISRNMVRLMGGELRLESALGQGTTVRFDVKLPLAEQVEAAPAARRVVGLAPGQGPFRIAVVDDQPENRLLLSQLLAGVGFETREAATGAEAVRLWEQWQPHLIWMDIRMPDQDGRSAIARIREAEAQRAASGAKGRPRCPIVALTASAFEHEREEILACGADAFVTKPYREATIFEELERQLGVRFVLEDSGEAGSPGAAATGLDAARWSRIDASTMERLRRALVEGDAVAAEGAISAVEVCDAEAAAAMRALVSRYEFDQLLEVLLQAGREPGS